MTSLVDVFRHAGPPWSKESAEEAMGMATQWRQLVNSLHKTKGRGIEARQLTLQVGFDMRPWTTKQKMLKKMRLPLFRKLAQEAGLWARWPRKQRYGTDIEYATTIGLLSHLASFLQGDARVLVYTQEKARLTQSMDTVVATMIDHDQAQIAFPYATWVGVWTNEAGQQRELSNVPTFAAPPVNDGRGARVVFGSNALHLDDTRTNFGCAAVVFTREAAEFVLAMSSLFRFRADDENLMAVLMSAIPEMRISVALPTSVALGWQGRHDWTIVESTAFATYAASSPSLHAAFIDLGALPPPARPPRPPRTAE